MISQLFWREGCFWNRNTFCTETTTVKGPVKSPLKDMHINPLDLFLLRTSVFSPASLCQLHHSHSLTSLEQLSVHSLVHSATQTSFKLNE